MHSKGNNKTKITHRLGENDVIENGLVSKIYKQLMMLNSTKQKPNQQMGRRQMNLLTKQRLTDLENELKFAGGMMGEGIGSLG